MLFKNPDNGYVESMSVPGLWCFLFGPFYFLVCGVWIHALIMFAVAAAMYAALGPPATMFVPIVTIVYAFMASDIIKGYYLRKGWVLVDDSTPVGPPDSLAAPAAEIAARKCPFCAEEIRIEAIKCKHCGSDIPCVPISQ